MSIPFSQTSVAVVGVFFKILELKKAEIPELYLKVISVSSSTPVFPILAFASI